MHSSASDPTVGQWKVNIDESATPMVASELLTISVHGDEFNLDFEETNDNKYNPHYSITTDMKGESVKPKYADGAKSDDSWSVTRKDPRSFDMKLSTPFGGWTDQYKVSPDGKKMTMHRVPGRTPGASGLITVGRTNGKPIPQTVLVFDRVR
jgi:hypothetical protein